MRVAFPVRGTAHYHVLADVVVIAYHQQTLFARVVEVLRRGAQDGVVMYLVSFSHTGALQDFRACHDDAVVSNFHVAFDVCEGLNRYVLAELCGRIYKC